MAFFKIEDDALVIDRNEVRGIPVFRTILERDRGSKGDADGRKKEFAFKEFMFIYLTCDFRSWVLKSGENEKTTHKLSIKDAGLPDDYKPDAVVKEAMELYKERQYGELPSLGTVEAILTGLKVSQKIAKSIAGNIEATLEAADEERKRKLENKEQMLPGDDLVLAQGLVGQLKQLLDISNKIPETVSTLEQLRDKLSKEESGTRLGRGSKEIGNRADPKK